MSRWAVIGGGLGGLAAAIRLAHAGREVILLERNERTGGKMNLLEEGGFRFDTGPTILTFPQVLERLFASVDRRLEDHLDLRPLDPQWRAFFEDGSVVDVWGDPARMEEQIRRLCPEDAAGWPRFREYARRMHELGDRFFFWRSVGGLRDLLRAQEVLGPEGLGLLARLDPLATVSSVIDRHFRDRRLRQILEHFMQYVGSSPHRAPAILTSIHHIQLEMGVWYPMGGMRRIAEALTRLAEELGVRIRTGVTVERIGVQGRRVRSVEFGGERLSVDGIVANSDFVRSHRELLPLTATARRIRRRPARYEPSCSGVVIYFGVGRRYDQLAHHDFFFSRDPRREFEDIYRRRVATEDPTLCVCVPSRTDPSAAPAGCESVYVLVHVPFLQEGQDWRGLYPSYRDLILEKLERCGLDGFRERIRLERWMTPVDLDARYRVDRGAIYGIASHGRLRGGFKPPNRSPDFSNLYFCGGSVNPGPGVPMALMSGQIAADCVLEDAG